MIFSANSKKQVQEICGVWYDGAIRGIFTKADKATSSVVLLLMNKSQTW